MTSSLRTSRSGVRWVPETVGIPAFLDYVRPIRRSLADYHCEIIACVTEFPHAFARMRFSGIHAEPFRGFAPTGKLVHWEGAALFTFNGDLISSLWVLGDLAGLDASFERTPHPDIRPLSSFLLPPSRFRGLQSVHGNFMPTSTFDLRPIDLRSASPQEYERLNALRNVIRREILPQDPPWPCSEDIQRWQAAPRLIEEHHWVAWDELPRACPCARGGENLPNR